MTSDASWVDHFAGLKRLPADLLDLLKSRSAVVSLPAFTRIYGPGQSPENFLLLLEGSIKVQQVSESGREIVLYRLSAGESCALTTACLMGYDDYRAEAITETDVKAVAIPRATFDELIGRSAEFRRFVFTAFSARVTDLFRVIEQIAFARMDIRLAQKLIELSHGTGEVGVTQQALASELGTAREVVSRLLSEFQRRGWLVSGRGLVTLTDRAALAGLAGER